MDRALKNVGKVARRIASRLNLYIEKEEVLGFINNRGKRYGEKTHHVIMMSISL